MSVNGDDEFEILERLSAELDRAKRAHKLLAEIWFWTGNAGRDPSVSRAFILKPESQKIIASLTLPIQLQSELDDYFKVR